MPVINSVAAMKDEIAAWRRELHQNPQTSYEETFASGFVAQKLTEWGIPFKRGIAKTGIVATIKGRASGSGKTIMLRADMDALDITEKSGQPWASKNPGKMHACGHDGHTATLLGAAKYLSENPNFDGTVYLLFQPAEEGGGGAMRMIEEGLFKDFPADYVFGWHNWPGVPLGKIAMRAGPVMASVDEFHITITGVGGHAAIPHLTVDPVVVASHIVTALQTIVARNVDPIDTVVVSVTNINSGTGAFNIIPDSARLTGTIRTFNNQTRDMVVKRLRDLTSSIAAGFGATAACEVIFMNAATVNTEDGIAMAAQAAAHIVGKDKLDTACPPSMGGEDFGAYLMKKPGAFIFLGQGVPDDKNSPHNHGLHSPFYDFNDDVTPVAISYFSRLVEDYMPLKK